MLSKIHSPRILLLLLGMSLAACSTGAQQGAERGAKTGAVGGLVAGAVGSIFWGGDAVNNALRSATVGAASGAAVGAMHGAERDKKAPPPAPTPAAQNAPIHDAEMKARVGTINFAASEELARCRHVGAIAKAEQAFKVETDPKRRNYAMLIQAMAAEESGNTAKAADIYTRWGQFDPAHVDRQKGRSEALDGILKLQKIRQEQGLPPLCT